MTANDMDGLPMLRVKLFFIAMLLLSPGCARQQQPAPAEPGEAAQPSDIASLTAEATAAVTALAGSLMSQLQAAMQAGGADNALQVCSTVAPAIASSVSQQHSMTVQRVSLKSRNPDTGVANDWQTGVLLDFESRKSAGESPGSLVYAEIVDDEFRFMKAIPTSALCLECHGSQLEPDLVARIAGLYPQDRAVGFREGDLRGAFVVTRRLRP